MNSLLRILRILTVLSVLASAILLCWIVIDIYISGSSADPAVAGSIFSVESISSRFKAVSCSLSACALILVISLAFHVAAPENAISGPYCASRVNISNKTTPRNGKGAVRLVCLFLSLLFILLGVMNGGAFDVFVKAIKICTECIGLG